MKKIFCLILCLIILLSLLVGCADNSNDQVVFDEFTVIKTGMSEGYHYRILKHNETGVYYLQMYSTHGLSGLSVMLNADGTPYTGNRGISND